MKFLRVLLRIALLSVAAAAFVESTRIYGGSGRTPMPSLRWQTTRGHRPSAPKLSEFPEFLGEGLQVAFFTLIGRIGLRLRLSPPSRNEGQPVLLDLR